MELLCTAVPSFCLCYGHLTLQVVRMFATVTLEPIRLQPWLCLQDDDADALNTTPIQLIHVSCGYAFKSCFKCPVASAALALLILTSLP